MALMVSKKNVGIAVLTLEESVTIGFQEEQD